MKHLDINKPCKENWADMSPTEKGAFCDQCCKQVIDFSSQSLSDIKETLLKRSDDEVCARITDKQLDTLNADYKHWRVSNRWSMQRASFYAFLFVFGLTLVSCSQKDEKQIIQTQKTAIDILQKNEKSQSLIVAEDLKGEKQETLPPPIEEIIPDEGFEQEYLVRIADSVLPPIEIERTYVTMGAMVHTAHYLEYLEDVVPTEEKRDEAGNLIPTEFSALAYPNPTEGRSNLKFEVPKSTKASIELFDASGLHLRSILMKDFIPGTFEIPIDLSMEKPGTYIIAILGKDFKESIKIIKI